MPKFNFVNGAKYSRADVLRSIGMDPPPTWGPYVNGYFERDGVHFIFCNIGVPGRTGHDYPNRFDGDDLIWTGKNGSAKGNPSIQRMTAPTGEVHVFFRRDNRSIFTYVGVAKAKSVDDSSPVGVRWSFYQQKDEGGLPISSGGAATSVVSVRTEGALTTVQVNRYERSPAARAQCIDHYGPTCRACEFNFGETYGKHGEGFIHVHHHIPLAEVKAEYVVDPIADLIPLCPNCHAMIHRGEDTLTLDDVRRLVSANRKPTR